MKCNLKKIDGSLKCQKCGIVYQESEIDAKHQPYCGYGLVKMAINFVKSSKKHLATGAASVPAHIHTKRFSICRACEFFDDKNPKNPRCQKCGCLLKIKTSWASESCPINKWKSLENKNKPCKCGKKKSKNTS